MLMPDAKGPRWEDETSCYHFDRRVPCLSWQPKRTLCADELQQSVGKLQDILRGLHRKHGIKNVLVDCRKLGERSVSEVAWLAGEGLYQMYKSGMRSLSLIAPSDLVGDALVDCFLAVAQQPEIQIRVFGSPALARECLANSLFTDHVSAWQI